MKKGLAILGSTGSIGTQALEVIRENPEEFSVEVLVANRNVELLAKQAMEFVPNAVVIKDEEHYGSLKETLRHLPVKVFCGDDAVIQSVEMDGIDMVLTAMVGFAGLKPTIRAIQAGKHIALANKETLVVGGELITELATEKGVAIIPVDSEHSAIFQCLVGEPADSLEKIYLTASGGPFRGKNEAFLSSVSVDEALNHPNWCMGPKITIDSATLMNKGLEVIEARWLFGLKPEQVEVVIHPQSIIHSLVQFIDGSMKAQMGLPDMRLPIQYALAYPMRIASDYMRFNFMDYPKLTFESPDTKNFRNLAISFAVLREGGNRPCVMNAANEIAVEAFLNQRIRFTDIPVIIEQTLEKTLYTEKPELDDLIASDREARHIAEQLIR